MEVVEENGKKATVVLGPSQDMVARPKSPPNPKPAAAVATPAQKRPRFQVPREIMARRMCWDKWLKGKCGRKQCGYAHEWSDSFVEDPEFNKQKDRNALPQITLQKYNEYEAKKKLKRDPVSSKKGHTKLKKPSQPKDSGASDAKLPDGDEMDEG